MKLSHMRSPLRNKKAFSLIELQVALTIFGLVIIGVISSTILFAKSIRHISDNQEFDAITTQGMATIGNDVRMANQFSLANKTNLSISMSNGNIVEYFLEEQSDGTSNLIRKAAGNLKIIAKNVENLSFELSGTNDRFLDIDMNLKKMVAKGKTRLS